MFLFQFEHTKLLCNFTNLIYEKRNNLENFSGCFCQSVVLFFVENNCHTRSTWRARCFVWNLTKPLIYDILSKFVKKTYKVSKLIFWGPFEAFPEKSMRIRKAYLRTIFSFSERSQLIRSYSQIFFKPNTETL